MKKLVQFGAGKIGRSFIGQLYSLAGYEVVFVDVDQRIINELNRRRSYTIIIKSDKGDEVIHINNVRGVHTDNEAAIIQEISETDLITTAVGQSNLVKIASLIARGIERKKRSGNETPTDIVLAENLRDASEFMRNQLASYLPSGFPIDTLIGFVETSIGKMVPIMSEKDVQDDVLQVFAEPYNTLILDRKGFKNSIPEVPGLAPKDNMKAWVDRKSFIHNLGHATGAYYGHCLHPDAVYMWEVLADQKVFNFTRETMQQSADILLTEYPSDFTIHNLEDHIDDLLKRFQNRALGDTVFRVGLDLYRKLGSGDRLAGVIQMAKKKKMPYGKILKALLYGFYFKATDENGMLYPGDEIFHKEIENKEINYLLSEICGFSILHDKDIFKSALTIKKTFHQENN